MDEKNTNKAFRTKITLKIESHSLALITDRFLQQQKKKNKEVRTRVQLYICLLQTQKKPNKEIFKFL